MRRLLALMALLVLPLSLAAEAPISRSDFEAAAARIHQNPLGPKARQDASTVVTWTTESPAVLVQITPPIIEILQQDRGLNGTVLVTAYMAGQAQAQLRAGKKGGFQLEGGREAIYVYHQIQKTYPDYQNQAIKRMIVAEATGQLAQLLAPPE